MTQHWTLHVENLGRIGEADIKVKPFMFFVGDNNSGKSYLLTVLWGLLALGQNLIGLNNEALPSYKRCEEWLKQHAGEKHVVMDQEACQLYVDWFNELLSKHKNFFLARLFNYPVKAERIEIRDYHLDYPVTIDFDAPKGMYSLGMQTANEENGERHLQIEFHMKEESEDERISARIHHDIHAYICGELLMGGMAEPYWGFPRPLLRKRRGSIPVYLPTSRNGFMLVYKSLLSHSLSTSFGTSDMTESTKLSMPYISFLQMFTRFESRKMDGKSKQLLAFLEKYMLAGTFKIAKGEVPDIQFLPQGYDPGHEIPLHVTSSVITEVAPFALLLKSQIPFRVIIIEEPEAHLHPALQKRMAQFIIRLMNAGKIVWMATHSDTIIQHVNNMLKLGHHPQKASLMKEYHYEEEDLIADDKAGMYQFSVDRDKGKTSVTELPITPYGFEVPTFNDALDDILREVYEFQGDGE